MPARLHLTCTLPACGNPHYARGLCRSHYVAQRNRAIAAASKPIAARVAPATLLDLQPMPQPAAPASINYPPAPAWLPESAKLDPMPAAPAPVPRVHVAPLASLDIVERNRMKTTMPAAPLPLPVFPAAPRS